MGEDFLVIRNLQTSFYTMEGTVRAVDGVSFRVDRGKAVGLVGESGCGKSTTALAILRLVPEPGRIEGGEILLEGKDILQIPSSEMRKIRGKKIAMTFQDPMTFLNPRIKVVDQIAEAILLHGQATKKEAEERAIAMLEEVKISSPSKRATDYPHQLSGGMKQRVLLAIALSCHPELLIADEPTTALDLIIQADILDLINELKTQLNLSLLLITHDLGIVAGMCETVVVMYAGRVLEWTDVNTIFRKPKHPYTYGLIECVPKMDSDREKPLKTIEGVVPELVNLPPGCAFHPRCPYGQDKCAHRRPELFEIDKDHFVACHRAGEIL